MTLRSPTNNRTRMDLRSGSGTENRETPRPPRNLPKTKEAIVLMEKIPIDGAESLAYQDAKSNDKANTTYANIDSQLIEEKTGNNPLPSGKDQLSKGAPTQTKAHLSKEKTNTIDNLELHTQRFSSNFAQSYIQEKPKITKGALKKNLAFPNGNKLKSILKPSSGPKSLTTNQFEDNSSDDIENPFKSNNFVTQRTARKISKPETFDKGSPSPIMRTIRREADELERTLALMQGDRSIMGRSTSSPITVSNQNQARRTLDYDNYSDNNENILIESPTTQQDLNANTQFVQFNQEQLPTNIQEANTQRTSQQMVFNQRNPNQDPQVINSHMNFHQTISAL